MSVKRIVCAAVALAVLCISGISYAEPSFKLGFSERARHEYWKDIFDNNDDVLDNRNFFRFKTSAWLDAQISKDFKAFVKFSNENRAYTYWGVNTTGNKDFHYDANEIVFDNLYFDVNNILGAPFDLRIGRQDLLGAYGEGFLIMEGTPQDGSRTFYFNAVKGAWRVNDVNTLDFIYINNPRDDVFLPVLNEDKAPQNLNTTDEEAYVLYWKNKGLKNLLLENYYIYKREDDDGGRGLQGEKSKINALGSYAKYSFAPWTLRGQYAYQFGKYGTRDRSAMGGFVFLDRAFEDAQWKPVASLGFSYLSGDKRNSSKVEAWDPLFSRCPWVSEIYVLSMGTETGVLGYWTNVQVWQASVSMKPTAKMKLSFWYNFLRAPEQINATTVFSSSGKDRGHLPQARLDYTVNKNISTYFLAEYFIPGNFYVNNRDASLFLRTEVQFKF